MANNKKWFFWQIIGTYGKKYSKSHIVLDNNITLCGLHIQLEYGHKLIPDYEEKEKCKKCKVIQRIE